MIKLSPSQQHVVEEFPEFLCNNDSEMTISGFAGSGKSFLTEYLANTVEKQQKLVRITDSNVPFRRLYFTATTNKAAEVLRTMLKNRPTQTIHKLLGLVVWNDRATGKQNYRQKDRVQDLSHSIVFIDESSMIDYNLLTHIRAAQEQFIDCKIVFIGDAYQLPPVKEDVCPVFDPNASNVFFLKEIQRQVEDSPIIKLSAEYRARLDDHTLEWPEIPHDGETIVYYNDKQEFFEEIETAYTKDHTPDQLKIVAWSNKRVRAYNGWIRKLQGMTDPFHIGELVVTNKPLFSKNEIIASTDTRHMISHIRDAVEEGVKGFWIRVAGKQDHEFFQPLNWGQAQALIDHHAANARQTGDWQTYFRLSENWADLRPIHASTVHKAQGSTYDEVFVDLSNIGTNNQWREVARLVYVAITRAKYRVHIYGGLTRRYNKKPPINLMEGFVDVASL